MNVDVRVCLCVAVFAYSMCARVRVGMSLAEIRMSGCIGGKQTQTFF